MRLRRWGAAILLILSICQVKIATSPNKDFYIFPDSISRVGDKVIFTGRVTEGRKEYITCFLASCSKRTYIVYASQIRTKTGVNWYQNHSKNLLAIKGSAMDTTLDLLCGPVEYYNGRKIREYKEN